LWFWVLGLLRGGPSTSLRSVVDSMTLYIALREVLAVLVFSLVIPMTYGPLTRRQPD